MDNNPYRTPQAAIEPEPEGARPHDVRTLVRVLVAVQLAVIALVFVIPDTLPPELRRMRDERETAFFNTHAAVAFLMIAMHIVSLVGLWWQRGRTP